MCLIAAIVFFTRQGVVTVTAVLAANAVLHNLFLTGSYFLDGFATAIEQMRAMRSARVIALPSAGREDRAHLVPLFRHCRLAAVSGCLAATVIDWITTSADVRSTARDYLWLAALTPAVGAAAFLYDGVFIGATWSRRHARHDVCALALAAVTFFGLRGLGNTGLCSAC